MKHDPRVEWSDHMAELIVRVSWPCDVMVYAGSKHNRVWQLIRMYGNFNDNCSKDIVERLCLNLN